MVKEIATATLNAIFLNSKFCKWRQSTKNLRTSNVEKKILITEKLYLFKIPTSRLCSNEKSKVSRPQQKENCSMKILQTPKVRKNWNKRKGFVKLQRIVAKTEKTLSAYFFFIHTLLYFTSTANKKKAQRSLKKVRGCFYFGFGIASHRYVAGTI